MKIDPEFRFKICGVREETPYDTSKYQMQPNPELPEAGGVKLAANEKEVLLLELFPLVAKNFLTDMKVKAYAASKPAEPKAEEKKAEESVAAAITGNTVTAPLPGRIIEFKVKVGDTVKAGQEIVVLEAMKMENSVTTDYAGTVKQIPVSYTHLDVYKRQVFFQNVYGREELAVVAARLVLMRVGVAQRVGQTAFEEARIQLGGYRREVLLCLLYTSS